MLSFERGVTGWFPAKVVFSLEEMVKVQATFQNDKRQECWVELESWKISRSGNMTKNEKCDNQQYFQELYKFIEPVQSSSQQRYQNNDSYSRRN